MKKEKNRDDIASPKTAECERHPTPTENEKFIRDFWQQRHNGPIIKDKGDEVDAEKSMER